jgi:hypothetical protein
MLRNHVLVFQRAVEKQLQREENPGVRSQHRLVGDFIASNKRDVMFFVFHGASSTMYEIKYKMPVPEQIEKLFPNQSLEPAGPTFFESRVAVGAVPAHVQASAERFGYLPWAGEVQRLATKLAGLPDTPENKSMRKTVRNIMEFWRGMREMLLDAFDNIDIIVPGIGSSDSGYGSGSPSPADPGSRRSSSRSHRRSSSRRRHSSAKSHHTPSRHSTPRTSDPKPKPESDPRRRKSRSRTRTRSHQ